MTRVWHQSFTVLEDVGPYVEAMRRHLDARRLPDTTIDFHGMRPGTYPSAYPGTHIRYSYLSGLHKEQFVAAALQARAEDYDAFLIATIPDTGFEEIRSLVDLPVVAFGNASVAFAATLAPTVGIVNFIDALQPQLHRNMRDYGFGEIVGPIVSIGRGFTDIVSAYDDPAPLLAAFTVAARRAIADGAQVIVPGEGPLNIFLADQGVSRVDDVPVIDSLGVGLALCEVRARMYRTSGLVPSRRGFFFETPPAPVLEAAREFYRGAAE
ncbi:aspartate/glutamate racemase family protein [Actinoallomurus sp. CA-142502]|uniref:aspartate/glutamate racemase family protein n=1 Tax=Actinoallomurus sp. CA-142502 TaxID=3239885 RepID=UPI003D89D542